MRPTICVTLLAVWLSVRGLDARTPAVARAVETSSAAAKGVSWSDTVSAHGRTQAEARQAVRDKASQRVAEYLIQRAPGLRWVPSAEELGRWVSLQEPSDPTVDNTEWGGAQYKAQLRVEVSDRNLEEILAQDQRERASARQLLSAKLLVALVALLAAVAGYFRLEELTRGYYTGVLRMLLLLCVGVVGAGLWLVL